MQPFLEAIAPYRDGLVVAVECIFTRYWLADLCAQEGFGGASSSPSPRPGPTDLAFGASSF